MAAAFASVRCTVIEVLPDDNCTVVVEAWYWPRPAGNTADAPIIAQGPLRFRFRVHGRHEGLAASQLIKGMRFGDVVWREGEHTVVWQPTGEQVSADDCRVRRLILVDDVYTLPTL